MAFDKFLQATLRLPETVVTFLVTRKNSGAIKKLMSGKTEVSGVGINPTTKHLE